MHLLYMISFWNAELKPCYCIITVLFEMQNMKSVLAFDLLLFLLVCIKHKWALKLCNDPILLFLIVNYLKSDY